MAIKLKSTEIDINTDNYVIYTTIMPANYFDTCRFYDAGDASQVSIGEVSIIGHFYIRNSDIPEDIRVCAQRIGTITENDQIVTVICCRCKFDNHDNQIQNNQIQLKTELDEVEK